MIVMMSVMSAVLLLVPPPERREQSQQRPLSTEMNDIVTTEINKGDIVRDNYHERDIVTAMMSILSAARGL